MKINVHNTCCLYSKINIEHQGIIWHKDILLKFNIMQVILTTELLYNEGYL